MSLLSKSGVRIPADYIIRPGITHAQARSGRVTGQRQSRYIGEGGSTPSSSRLPITFAR